MVGERDLIVATGKTSAGAISELPAFATARRTLVALGAAIAFLFMWALYTRIAWSVPMNSDNATALLQADDFVNGNYLLRGWIAGSMSIYTTELPFYVVGVLVAGFTPSLLRIVPALQFTMVVALSMWLTYRERRAQAWPEALILTFLMLALPWGYATWLLLVSFKHIGTVLMILAAILTLTLIDEHPHRRSLYPLFLALLTFATMDDELALYIGALPIALVLTMKGALEWHNRGKQRAVLAALALVSAPLAILLAHLIIRAGGFVAYAPEPVIVRAATMVGNTSLASRGLLLLFGADPFDRFGVLRPLPFAASALVHVFSVIVIGIGAWSTLRRAFKREHRAEIIAPILLLAIVTDLACFIVSDRPVEISSARYLTPVVVFGAVMAGIAVSPFSLRRGFRWLTVAIAAVYIATFMAELFLPQANHRQETVVEWLEQHQLTHGYGSFWAANILTAESGGAVKIRPVRATDTGYHPRPWMMNQNWYTISKSDGSFNFLVLGKPSIDNVNEASARKFFGDPKDEYQVAGYQILVWDKRLPVK
jgi:hypothetical protein